MAVTKKIGAFKRSLALSRPSRPPFDCLINGSLSVPAKIELHFGTTETLSFYSFKRSFLCHCNDFAFFERE